MDTQEDPAEAALIAFRGLMIKTRLTNGWTQKDLAARMGVKQAYISELETGDISRPGVHTLSRWANALGCAFGVFIHVRGHFVAMNLTNQDTDMLMAAPPMRLLKDEQ